MTSQHHYMSREQNAPRLARALGRKDFWKWALSFIAVLAFGIPFVEPSGSDFFLIAWCVGSLSALFVLALFNHPPSVYSELDSDGYAKVHEMIRDNDQARALVESWIRGGELFLTYADLEELEEWVPRLSLAESIGSSSALATASGTGRDQVQ